MYICICTNISKDDQSVYYNVNKTTSIGTPRRPSVNRGGWKIHTKKKQKPYTRWNECRVKRCYFFFVCFVNKQTINLLRRANAVVAVKLAWIANNMYVPICAYIILYERSAMTKASKNVYTCCILLSFIIIIIIVKTRRCQLLILGNIYDFYCVST